jgi:hypothetical protein
MDDEEAYLDYLMEEMEEEQLRINLAPDQPGKYVLVSTLILREVMGRVDAAPSDEEGKQMLSEFMKNVIRGNITPYQ